MQLAYYGTAAGREFLARQGLWLLSSAALLVAVFGTTDIDSLLARGFFDATRQAFPLTNDWLLKDVLHDAARTASVGGWLVVLGATCVGFSLRRFSLLHSRRHDLAFVALALLTAAATVGALKHFSAHACPWDVAEFGGRMPFDAASAAPGCRPAAHPLAGYAWLCLGLVLYPASRARARLAWLAAGALGTLFGFVQMARGAHFLSHVLWSAWVTWAVELALLAAWVTAASRWEPHIAIAGHKPQPRTRTEAGPVAAAAKQI